MIKNQIKLIKEKDPSIKSIFEVFIHPSMKAAIYYKMGHYLYNKKLYFLSKIIMNRLKKKTGIEIHPGAIIGNNLFIDHGCGIVIGQTSIIGNNVIIYHGVTLGTNGKEKGKRHPTIEDNVLLGANATILGNITIKENAKVGAGAVVVSNVKENTTVVGIPSKVVRDYNVNSILELLKYY